MVHVSVNDHLKCSISVLQLNSSYLIQNQEYCVELSDFTHVYHTTISILNHHYLLDFSCLSSDSLPLKSRIKSKYFSFYNVAGTIIV